MELFEKLLNLIQDCEEDAHKFYNKGNKTAGTRVRKTMQEIKKLAQEIRVNVQEIKNQG